MSLINQEDLQIVKTLNERAIKSSNYTEGYHLAMQALEKTMSIISSVELITKDIEIKIIMKG